MVILGMIVRGVQKGVELGIGHGSTVHIEARGVTAVAMGAPRDIFPGILHINPGIISALYLNPTHVKVVVSSRNTNHSRRRTLRPLGGWDLDHQAGAECASGNGSY